jgi:hypothetical protein
MKSGCSGWTFPGFHPGYQAESPAGAVPQTSRFLMMQNQKRRFPGEVQAAFFLM